MDKDFLGKRTQSDTFSRYQTEAGAKTPASRETRSPEESNDFLPFFLIELLNRFKTTLNSIKTFNHLPREKLNDLKLREYFYRVMDQDIEEMDSTINSLLSYIRVNHPLVKSNTIHLVLDEILKKHEKQLNLRRIKIVKKFEKDLRETVVHESQLRFIFNCILEYAILFTVPNGSLGLVTKLANVPKEAEGQYLEVAVVFTGYKKDEQPDASFGAQAARRGEKMDLKLLLVEEIVRKNHGVMKFDVDEKKPRTQILLFFPIERRRIVYYPSLNSP